jgi:hypothetical protein
MPESTESTAVVESSSAGPEPGTAEYASANVKAFAAQLKAEHVEGDPPEDATAPDEQAAKPSAKPASTAKAPDVDALRAAYRDGDVAKLAELLDEDVSKTKITKSRWAEFRIASKRKDRKLAEQQGTIEAERAAIEAERSQLSEAASTLRKVNEAVRGGDLQSAIELVTGQGINEVLDILLQDSQNPANREVRALKRREAEREARDAEAAKQSAAQQEMQARQRETAVYLKDLEASIKELPIASSFVDEYGAEFTNLVFQEQSRHWDGVATIPVERAVKNVLKVQLAAYDRGQKHFESLREALGQSSGAPKSAVQGNRRAQLSPRKSVTTAQGGPVQLENMTKQQINAYFARQLKASNAG